PVITSEEPGKINLMEWGLVPNWVKDEKTASDMRNFTLNARSETLFEKPSFRSILKKRCLVLVNGFYEWQTKEPALKTKRAKEKIPFYIHLKSQNLFAMGGLYDEWVNTATGEIFSGFSIITVPANPLMAVIHNTKKRMPFILPAEKEKNWLQAEANETQIKSLITQYPEEDMEAEEIESEKNNRPEQTGRLF
ncbi:MAG TPA: SOS response-associated peptidase, partial [Bacteroidia bacterium]|nr:SOS response-associated peptidase [Bacteroidia bacterium]